MGAAEKADRLRDWTVGMVGFDQILSGLKEVKAAPRVEEEEEEEEEEEPKKVKEKGKKAKEKAKEKEKARKEEEQKKADEEATKKKQATHVGRYHKRENAKRVRCYSSEDLAAILGSVPGGSQPPVEDDRPFMKEVRAEAQEDSEVSSSGHMSDQETHPASKKVKLSKKEEEEEEAPQVKSWWMGLFVRAGRMGSTRKELKSKKVTAKVGFSEKDQENLYTDVHNHATHGKQGLGIGDAPKKVAGARWQGTKTKLDSDDEDEEAVADEQDEEASSEEEDTGIVVLSAKKPAQIDSLKSQPREEKKKGKKPKDSQSEKKVDVVEMAAKILREEKSRALSLKELKSRYLKAAGLSKHDSSSEKPAKRFVKAIKANTAMFKLVEKKVLLLQP